MRIPLESRSCFAAEGPLTYSKFKLLEMLICWRNKFQCLFQHCGSIILNMWPPKILCWSVSNRQKREGRGELRMEVTWALGLEMGMSLLTFHDLEFSVIGHLTAGSLGDAAQLCVGKRTHKWQRPCQSLTRACTFKLCS